MNSGVPFSPSFTATTPMMSTHFMGMDPSTSHYGMQNYNTQSTPWVSNHFSHGILDMSSHLPSSVSSPYVNTSLGSGGMMRPSYPSPLCGSHILQTPLTVGGWNLLSYKSFMREVSAQLRNHSTCYTPSSYPSSTMMVPTNTFPMVDPHLPFGVSSGGSYFYSMGNPPHKVPSSGGNIYPRMSNPCHATFSSQAASSVSIPLQTFMNQ
jgi:hypothetical protein